MLGTLSFVYYCELKLEWSENDPLECASLYSSVVFIEQSSNNILSHSYSYSYCVSSAVLRARPRVRAHDAARRARLPRAHLAAARAGQSELRPSAARCAHLGAQVPHSSAFTVHDSRSLFSLFTSWRRALFTLCNTTSNVCAQLSRVLAENGVRCMCATREPHFLPLANAEHDLDEAPNTQQERERVLVNTIEVRSLPESV